MKGLVNLTFSLDLFTCQFMWNLLNDKSILLTMKRYKNAVLLTFYRFLCFIYQQANFLILWSLTFNTGHCLMLF